MKNLAKVTFFAFFFFILQSCKKEAIEQTPNNVKVNQLAEKTFLLPRSSFNSLELENYMEQYQTLTSEDKFYLWLDKIDHVLAIPNFIGVQRAFIELKRDQLSIAFFDTPSNHGFDQSFINHAKHYFSDEEIFRIFMTLKDFDAPLLDARPLPINLNGGVKCECLWSLYCGITEYCDTRLKCTPKDGCGIWGNSNCKGICSGRLTNDDGSPK